MICLTVWMRGGSGSASPCESGGVWILNLMIPCNTKAFSPSPSSRAALAPRFAGVHTTHTAATGTYGSIGLYGHFPSDGKIVGFALPRSCRMTSSLRLDGPSSSMLYLIAHPSSYRMEQRSWSCYPAVFPQVGLLLELPRAPRWHVCASGTPRKSTL